MGALACTKDHKDRYQTNSIDILFLKHITSPIITNPLIKRTWKR